MGTRILGLAAVWLATMTCAGQTNLFVAADGSAPFTSVQTAIATAPIGTASNQVIIHIKAGIYRELIYVQRERGFIRLVGKDAANTVLEYGLYASMTNMDGKPIGTFRTPSAYIDADNFSAENLTFANTAGPHGQALALRVDGDRVAFRRCRFLGWQDTILDNRGRHYYGDCDISGHVDFIFGAGAAFFENCRIHCLTNGYITAASTPSNAAFGFVFTNCVIDGATPLARTYLGRPWRPFASVAFLNCTMSSVVRPAGWDNWRDPRREKTVRYAEYGSAGPGGEASGRVKWARQLTAEDLGAYSLENVIGGADHWRP
jgi:pectinesterase